MARCATCRHQNHQTFQHITTGVSQPVHRDSSYMYKRSLIKRAYNQNLGPGAGTAGASCKPAAECDPRSPPPDKNVWGWVRTVRSTNPQTFWSGDTTPRRFCLGMGYAGIPRQKCLGMVRPSTFGQSPDVFVWGWGILASPDENVWGLSVPALVANPQTFLSGDGELPIPRQKRLGIV